VAAVELALLLPFLIFLFVIAVDWARVFYYSVTVTNCARNGAMWLSLTGTQGNSTYTNVTQAALADAPNVSPAPTVTTASGSDASGPYVACTVTYPFHTVSNLPGVPSTTNITRTVRMSVGPMVPK